jgi:hypothetical protein
MQVVLYGLGTGWAIEYLPSVIVYAVHACIVVPYSLRYPYAVLAHHPLARLWLEVLAPLAAYVFTVLPLFVMVLPSLQHLIPFQRPVLYALVSTIAVRPPPSLSTFNTPLFCHNL